MAGFSLLNGNGNGNGRELHVVMFPWLAYGHISPYLELSNRLAHAGLKVSLLSTPLNISKIRKSAAKSVQLVELALPPIEGLPSGMENMADVPLNLMPLFFKAMDGLETPFLQQLRRIRPHCVIFDFFQWWTPRAVAAAQLSIPTIFFHTCGAAFTSYAIHPAWRGDGKKITARDLTKPPSDYPSSVISWRLFEAQAEMRAAYTPHEPGGITFLERGLRCYEHCSAMAIKTCNEMEGSFVEYLQNKVIRKPVFPVGPLLPPIITSTKSMCLTWLEKQPPSSVVYVAFGSQCFLSKDEATEIALGLENSKQRFLWILRLPRNGGLLTDLLPQGFHERIEGRGIVVEEWAPQREILSHPSTGAFMTHCGWNSLMEGMSCGLPLIATPMQVDQHLNARLICEELRVGIEVERTEEGSLRREEICRAVRMAMVEKEGRRLRVNARQMGDVFKLKILSNKEGISSQELYINEFISQLQLLSSSLS